MTAPVVVIVDDEEPLRDSISLMLQVRGHETKSFASATAALEWLTPDAQAVVITDICMPGMNGIEFMRALKPRQPRQPVIALTGHGDIPLAVNAMKAGAAEFFEKPFDAAALAAAVSRLSDGLKVSHAVSQDRASVERRIASLSTREAQVLEQVLLGKSNKLIGASLSISARTAEAHRANILDKLGVRSTPELIGLIVAARAG